MEIHNILVNNKNHFARLANYVKEMRERIQANPAGLMVGCETASVQDIIRSIDMAIDAIAEYEKAANELAPILDPTVSVFRELIKSSFIQS